MKKNTQRPPRRVLRYLRCAPWPHGTALAALLLAFFLGANAVVLLHQSHQYEAAVLGLWSLGWAVVCAFALADGLARHREYRRIRFLLARHGCDTRILHLSARSRCQRDAALMAAREAGCFRQAYAYYRTLGYRWYHILPDSVLRNPLIFLSPRFLRNSFLPGRRCHRQP